MSKTTPLVPLNPATSKLYTTPIQERKQPKDWVRLLAFGILFDLGCLCINGTQFLLLPLWFLPFEITRNWYEDGIRYTKGSFGLLCTLISQWFAPSQFIVTTEGLDESIFVRDPVTNEVTGIELPKKLILMSNHQVYLDWLYLWSFTRYMNAHRNITIMLKKSLKWVPVVGWGMQFFRFIFMARSWNADKIPLGKHLIRIAKESQEADQPMLLMIFPEGTLVSKDTRPLSKKYADKMGLEDMRNMLLPRSTGLLFSLRTLAPCIPDLHLLDITIGYPGIPPAGYGQSFYTLRSVFMDGVPPPAVHLHLRMYNVKRDLHIGEVDENSGVGRGAEASEEDKAKFDSWLRDRWREKDDLMEAFYKTGHFASTPEKPGKSTADSAFASVENGIDGVKQTSGLHKGAVALPIELSSTKEILDAFCLFAPALAGYFGIKSFSFLESLFRSH